MSTNLHVVRFRAISREHTHTHTHPQPTTQYLLTSIKCTTSGHQMSGKTLSVLGIMLKI